MGNNLIINGKTISLFLLIIYAALPVGSPLGQTLLYINIPGAAILSYLCSKDKSQSRYMKLLLALFLWISFTTFFSFNIDISIVWLRRVVAVYLLCLAIHQITKERPYIPWTYLIWVVMYLTCLSYARNMIETMQFDYTVDRITDRALNANTLAYYTFFTTVAIYFWGSNSKKKISFLARICFLLTIPLSFYVAFITASRQVLIIQTPLILCLLYIRYIKMNSGLKAGLSILVFCVFSYLFASYILQIYEPSLLAQRSQITLDEDTRATLIQDGIRTGLDNILTGVGIGCFGFYNYGQDTFAHNTYIELFSTTGLVGFIIYTYMMFSFIIIQLKRYQRLKNYKYLVFMLIGLIYALDNIFYVFHTDPWLMAFFILLTNHAENIYQKDLNIV